jgi:F0F1-type ATP synthase delta subunit
MEHKEEQPSEQKRRLVLPVLIFGNLELHRILRELLALEDYIRQNEIRQPGKQTALPKTSRMLDEISTQNKLNLLLADHRQYLIGALENISEKAPVIHISFASDPSSAFMAKIVEWFRSNVHPYALVQLGLQPAIAAGFVLRTTNKQFDFSLAKHFEKQAHLLVEALNYTEAGQQQ